MAGPWGGERGRKSRATITFHAVNTPQMASCSHPSKYLVSKNMKMTFLMIPIICACVAAQ